MKKYIKLYRFFLRPLGRFFSGTLLLVLVFVLSSCSKKSEQNKAIISGFDQKEYVLYSVEGFLPDEIKLKQAKYADITVPIGFSFVQLVENPENKKQQQNKDFLCYLGDLSVPQIIKFYLISMERLGWQVSDFSTPYEGLLFCKKATRECVVLIRQDSKLCHNFSKKSCVSLFIKNKFCDTKTRERAIDLNSKQIQGF